MKSAEMKEREQLLAGLGSEYRITVCICSIPPRTDMLRRAIESVLVQTLPASGISIAIDHDRHGAAWTRTQALYGARTDWVAFLDDDDEFKPEHLAELALCQRETGADVVFPWFDTVGGSDPFPMFEGKEWDPAAPHMFPITTLVRRSHALVAGGFVTEGHLNGAGEDWLFWLTLRNNGCKIVHLNKRTWIWHHHGLNTSGMPERW